MGKHILGDLRGICLIGLVMSVLVIAMPQPSRAAETAEGDSPPAAAEPAGDAAAGAAAEGNDIEDSAAADGEEAAASGPGDAGETGTASEEPAPGAGAAEGEPETPAPANTPLDESAPANNYENPANPVPARAREPMTGANEPYEPGTSVAGGEDGEPGDEIDTNDPLEGMNRAFFKFNDFLDKLLLKPVAQLYRFILPDYVEDRVRNVVNNADSPVILANDILQWKWDRAWNTTSRFFINTTLGVGGIWDVAASFGIDRHDEDFGQTLCVWGVKEWIYLYLPFVGPTNPRDLTGKVVDRYFDPLTYYADVVQQIDLSDGVTIRWNVDTAGLAQLSLTAADLIDMRARNIETINEIERTSIDFYTAVRSLYRQSRENACNDGKVDFEELPDLSEEFE